ncbi:trefoil factor 1, partial [Rattus norvegicus]
MTVSGGSHGASDLWSLRTSKKKNVPSKVHPRELVTSRLGTPSPKPGPWSHLAHLLHTHLFGGWIWPGDTVQPLRLLTLKFGLIIKRYEC